MSEFTFRGKPIEWKIVEEVKTKEIPNAFTPDKPDIEEFIQKNNYIVYDNKDYHGIDKFFQGVFPEYKKYPYKVNFLNDNIFYLGKSQRAKLQYNILANKFGLVDVSEDEEFELRMFFQFSHNEPSKKAYQRIQWDNGLRKMVSFGTSLSVNGTNKDVFCYSKEEELNGTTYTSVNLEWEDWFRHLQYTIDSMKRDNPTISDMTVINELNKDIYYQTHYLDTGCHLTLKAEHIDNIKQWICDYCRKGTTVYPYNGKFPNSDLKFTIMYDDVDIVPQRNIKGKNAMAEYNKENNAEHNRQMGEEKAMEKFRKLKGDEWTKQELKDLGYNDTQIDNYCNKYHWIKRIEKGRYRRILTV